MGDRWAALKAWLDAERDKASEASREAATAVNAAVGASARDFNVAVRTADEANARCETLRGVAQKMGELERGESRPRLREQ